MHKPIHRFASIVVMLMMFGVAVVQADPPPGGQWSPAGSTNAITKAAGGVVEVVEFFNAGLEHYFVSADPAEVAVLDGGAFGGAWTRTGATFRAWDVAGAAADTVPVCRFFGTDRYRANGSRIGPNSHFYTADPNECANTRVAFQSVASDGISYPAWTFESNAVAVKLAVAGACPMATQPLYRSYNNGARGDPNHRYAMSAEVLQAMPGWVFEGLVMCLPVGPAPTAPGVATGPLTGATIGAAGGSVTAASGALTITIPPGALASSTAIGIQSLTNTAHGKIGAAYRLTPAGQTFLQPVRLTFTYVDDDLQGTSADFLGVAFQRPDGLWQWAGDPTVDATARTVSVSSTHFSDWSNVKGLQIRPMKKTVKTKGTVALQVRVCFEAASTGTSTDDLSALAFECEVDQGIVGTFLVDEWSVNGTLGGGGVFGTVAGNGPTATYTAPVNEPTPNTVAVSARVHNPKKGPTAKSLVSSSITITEDSWEGRATATAPGALEVVADVIWTLDKMVNNIATYKATGTVTVAVTGCTLNPSTNVIDPAVSEVLTVDYNANPATYHGAGGASWPVIITCPPALPAAAAAPGGFFGGSKGMLGVEAAGTVSADGNTIEGSDINEGVNFKWKFTRVRP